MASYVAIRVVPLCKVMEHILVSHIMQHLDTNNTLLDTQFGFRSKHSCELQLFLTTTPYYY